MITCVSSVFAWDQHSDEWRFNIRMAHKMWLDKGFKVIYVSKPINQLSFKGTIFTGDEDFCPIHRLLEVASKQTGLVALLDADLRIGSGIYAAMNEFNRGCKMITSRRWTILRRNDIEVKPWDFAVDFYMGEAGLFKEPSILMPKGCRVAHNLWDSWLVGYFNKTLGNAFRSVTKYKFLFHPQHKERNAPYGDDYFVEDQYSKCAGHPAEL